MAIASGARDDETIRAGIERWIRAHEPDCADAVVEPLTRPPVGLSSDTSFVTAVMPSGAARALVLRLPPAGEGLFPAYDLSLQVDRQEALRAAGIPTAAARFEADPAWLGAPFMVMPRVPGAVLATNPSYLRAGWLVDGGVERQQRVITAFLTTLGTLHRVPPTAVGAPPEPLTATLDRWSAYLDWAATGGAVPDYLARARDWCSERLPAVDATSSVESAAPGLRMIRAPSTPGISQTPYMKPWAGGNPVNAGCAAFHSWPQAQKMTPKAAAIDDATTMSTVRHDDPGAAVVVVCAVVMVSLPMSSPVQ